MGATGVAIGVASVACNEKFHILHYKNAQKYSFKAELLQETENRNQIIEKSTFFVRNEAGSN